jgi:hypothetical protein
MFFKIKTVGAILRMVFFLDLYNPWFWRLLKKNKFEAWFG